MCQFVVSNLVGIVVVNFLQFDREMTIELRDVTLLVAGRVAEWEGYMPTLFWCGLVALMRDRVSEFEVGCRPKVSRKAV